MRRNGSIALLAVCALLCVGRAGAVPDQDVRVESIRVAGDDNYAPYEFVDGDGNYRGFNVDIMNALSAQLGVDFLLMPMHWNDAVQALDSGAVDVVQGMNISKEREQRYTFSSPTVINTVAIFVSAQETRIKSLQDLQGKRVTVQRGDIGMELIQADARIDVTVLDDQEDCVALLGRGAVDAFLGDRQAGLSYVRQLDLESEIKIVGTPLKMSGYAIAVRGEDEELARLIEQGLDAIKLNGTYDKIYEKWFGVQFQDNSVVWKRTAVVAAAFLVVAVSVILAIYMWNRTLVRQVRLRTEELDKSNSKRKAILESVLDPILAIDRQGKIIMANGAARQFMRRGGLNGLSINDLGQDGLLDGSVVEAVLSGSAYNTQLELEEDGKRRYFDCNVSPIYGAGRVIVDGTILTLHNHTELLLLRDALYRSDKLSALGRMAASVAHELRNPLTAIKAYVDMIEAKIDNPDFRGKLVEVVPGELERMNGIINTLLDYASTRPKLVKRFFLAPLLAQITSLYQISLDKRQIRLTVRVQEGLTLTADAQQIRQVLINILMNSIEAIETDGEILIEAVRKGVWASIRIRDSGCGIPREALEHIFEPFYTSKSGGHGFGLLIVHNLVQENGGRISYESMEGRGTLVTLQFPTEEVAYATDFGH